MNRREKAVEYKHCGYNCCQAVLKVFEDKYNLTDDQIRALGSSFGVGMGCMEGTCGALVGAGIVASLTDENSSKSPATGKKLLQHFKDSSEDTICKNLKGIETGTLLCTCDDCVRHAVDALEELIFN